MTEYNLNNILEQQMEPQMALIVYKNNKNSNIYIESHEINIHGRMLAGKPLTKVCITELVGSFSVEQSAIPHGRIPENMLYFDTRKSREQYIWYNFPHKRMMYFKKDLNLEDREYFLPGIIYKTDGSKLELYAFKDEKPNENTKLYKAPFFNVTNQSVCLGSARISFPENPTFISFIEYWEKKFWLTEFSHLGGRINPTKHNLVIVTKNSTESFDYKELQPFISTDNKPITLKDILK